MTTKEGVTISAACGTPEVVRELRRGNAREPVSVFMD
jgi:hypothetical protein